MQERRYIIYYRVFQTSEAKLEAHVVRDTCLPLSRVSRTPRSTPTSNLPSTVRTGRFENKTGCFLYFLLKTHDYGVYRLVAGRYSIYELTGLASWKVPTNKQRGTCEEKTMNTGTSINLGEWMKTYGFSLSIAMTHGNITWGQAKQKAHEQKRQKERRISC